MSTYTTEKPKRYYDLPLADVSTRFVALVIDGLILGVIGALLGIGSRSGLGFAGSFIVGIAYQWYFLTQMDGQTPGKKMMNIRVVKTTGERLTFADVLVRYLGYYLNSAAIMIGWLWAFFDADRQGWHDKLANTLVVRA